MLNAIETPTWINSDDGFVAMPQSQIDATIQDYLREQYKAKAISRRILAAATLRQAEEAGEDDFGFGIFSDRRGRRYYHGCGLTPQGKDLAKGLIMAAQPRMLGPHGLAHLKQGVATTWGGDGIDKKGMAARRAYVDEMVSSGKLRAMVEGAKAGTCYLWRTASEPFQFLALAADLLAALDTPNPELYFSSVMVGYDATCSGLQVLSALTRCASTAAKVNVLPREDGTRADVYLELAAELNERCERLVAAQDAAEVWQRIEAGEAEGDDWAVFWQGKIDRSIAKGPCMVFCYGGKQRTFAGEIHEASGAPYKACMWLAGVMYNKVLPALLPRAHAFMETLQEIARMLAKGEKALDFYTENGLHFVQAEEATEEGWVRVRLPNGNNIAYKVEIAKGKLDSRKQANGAAPNIVHQFDALFLENAVLAFSEAGIDCFATVHDCFYLRAGDWGAMDETGAGGWTILRRVFRDTFGGDVVAKLWSGLEASSGMTLPPLPDFGSLDLNAVLRSEFLFS